MAQNDLTKSDSLETLDDLCRICGKSNDQMIPIFETHEYQLAVKINRYLPITVMEHDILPLRACITCALVIIQWHTLSESCIEVNETFSRMEREKRQVEHLDTNQSPLDFINRAVEIEVHQQVRELKNEVQHQSSQPFPINEKNIFGSNWSTNPSTSYQSQRPQNNYSTILNSIYEDISEDEEDENAVNNQPIDMTINSLEHPDDIEIIHDTSEPPMETTVKMMKLLKIQKIKDLLKKAQIRIQGKILYHCRKCMKNFSSHISYVYHVKNHSRPKTIENVCNICGKQFHAKLQLIRHMSKHHLRLRKLTCEQCRKVSDLSKKNNNERDSIKENYLCNVCKYKEANKIVYTPSTIIASIRISQEDCPTKCDNCQHYFPTESSLKYHISERSCMRLKNKLQQLT